jgi:drug/metabolite transporter (DMT)-like permease
VPTVTGFWATVGMGLVGGLIAEVIRIAEMLKKNERPSGREILGSALYVLMGGCVFFFGWQQPQKLIEVAALGAAFPFTFAGIKRSAGARATKDMDSSHRPLAGATGPSSPRSWNDYMASRF